MFFSRFFSTSNMARKMALKNRNIQTGPPTPLSQHLDPAVLEISLEFQTSTAERPGGASELHSGQFLASLCSWDILSPCIPLSSRVTACKGTAEKAMLTMPTAHLKVASRFQNQEHCKISSGKAWGSPRHRVNCQKRLYPWPVSPACWNRQSARRVLCGLVGKRSPPPHERPKQHKGLF